MFFCINQSYIIDSFVVSNSKKITDSTLFDLQNSVKNPFSFFKINLKVNNEIILKKYLLEYLLLFYIFSSKRFCALSFIKKNLIFKKKKQKILREISTNLIPFTHFLESFAFLRRFLKINTMFIEPYIKKLRLSNKFKVIKGIKQKKAKFNINFFIVFKITTKCKEKHALFSKFFSSFFSVKLFFNFVTFLDNFILFFYIISYYYPRIHFVL